MGFPVSTQALFFSKFDLKIFFWPVEAKQLLIYVGGQWGNFPKDSEAAFPHKFDRFYSKQMVQIGTCQI